MYRPKIDYDYELETSVLGACLLEPGAFGNIAHLLIPECFYQPDHERVYKVISEMFDKGFPIDLLTVARAFYDGGIAEIGHSNVSYFLAMLTFNVVTTAHLERWAILLRELAIKRATIELTSGGNRHTDPLAAAADIDTRMKRLMELKAVDDWQDGRTVGAAVREHMQSNKGRDMPGLTTSLSIVDRLNGGFRPGQLVLVGARPAVGKSAFMGRMVTKIAKTGVPVGIVSLEMDNKDIFMRMASAESGIDYYQIDRNEFFDAEENKMAIEGIARTEALPIFFSDTAKVSTRDIRAKAEKLMKKSRIGILFIDYLQLVEPDSHKGKNREQEVADISRTMKVFAKTLGIPVVMLVQLNRQAAKEEPKLEHLRESGGLEQDADVVFMLHRDTESPDPQVSEKATIFCRKWRNGSTPKMDMIFDGPKMRFLEPSEDTRFLEQPRQQRPDNPRAGIQQRSTLDDDLPF